MRQFGQSIWLDYIRRHLITSGELQRLVEDSHVTSVTANPSIFEKAILGSTDYDDALGAIARRGVCDAKTAYEALPIADIHDVARLLEPIYTDTQERDGFVSWRCHRSSRTTRVALSK